MKYFIVTLILFAFWGCNSNLPENKQLQLSEDEYIDRVKAMWVAQLVAVHIGWDFEHKPASVKEVTDYSDHRKNYIKENGGAQVDDDWYYEMVALRGFEKYGINMTTNELGETWNAYNIGTWGSAFYTREALAKGIPGEEAGMPQNNRMWFTMGNQNRCDLYAMLSPGLPNVTAKLSRNLGHINSYAEGTDGGVLIGTLASMAFYEKDTHELLKKGIQVLDPDAPHRTCFEEIIQLAEAGNDWKDIARIVEEHWGVEYPGTNSAVWNAGFAAIALWFGEGDLMKSLNIAYQESDFSDADCQAANVAVILAAMNGMKIFPEHLLTPFNNKIKGSNLGFMPLVEPVDESLDALTARTCRIGKQMLVANGASIRGGNIEIPVQTEIETQPLEYFHPNQFTQFWNPNWKMERAGFGAPGGGVRGVRGGTFVDGDVLATYPRDEIRGVKLFRNFTAGENQKLSVDVAADPGRKWILNIYIDNSKVLTKLIDGGEPLEWPEISADRYPQPLIEYLKCSEVRKWQHINLDLSDYSNQDITIRLYQDILVRNEFPGNAYWRDLEIK
ncbi:ADP-ribosylglycohydrolase family protein [uncultured Draconibacterium sp.]|uniref:ADP-ribosylglycohydrolase family protein n=1 Tax=uncultured Draconibacterium sp. TaxID=1573823 RepID=UPI0029C992CF|nr:ADP-ribosylglycohydrolase family protein [uncultured Draconibacterium sp.]